MQQKKSLLTSIQNRWSILRKVIPNILTGKILDPPKFEPRRSDYSRIVSLAFSVGRGLGDDRMHEFELEPRVYSYIPDGNLSAIFTNVLDKTIYVGDLLFIKEAVNPDEQEQGVTVATVSGLLFNRDFEQIKPGSVMITFTRHYCFTYVSNELAKKEREAS